MILNFKFKNFMSFADECDFSMLANSDKSHEENLVFFNKSKVSKTRLIYGANASGKTSFIQAINFIINFIRKSNLLLEGNSIGVQPFKFTSNYLDAPSEFSITFVKDEIKYNYYFSCTRKKVINERLDAFYSPKATNIFERTNTSEYRFNRDKNLLNELKERTLENKLFLVTAATWNYEATKPVVDYLLNDIVVAYDAAKTWKIYIDEIFENNEFDEFKEFCMKILNNADFSISDFTVETKKFADNEKEASILKELLKISGGGNDEAYNKLINTKVYSFNTFHDIIEDNGTERYGLRLEEESLGTIQMFEMAPLLYDVFKYGKVLFMDEIDKSLHPLLVEHIVKLFLNKELNYNNAQLIANTHDTNLLNLEIFRRDDIWFTERDYKTGKTKLFPLSDFSPRKGENIEKAYLIGRFGAIPFIQEE